MCQKIVCLNFQWQTGEMLLILQYLRCLFKKHLVNIASDPIARPMNE